MSDAIKHLKSNEIEELYRRYLDGEKVLPLMKEYNVDVHPAHFYRIFPPQKLNDYLCPYCEISMFRKRRAKSHPKQPIECFECWHKINAAGCVCTGCMQVVRRQRAEEEKIARRTIRQIYSVDNFAPVAYSELSFKQKLVLRTLFTMQRGNPPGYILSLNELGPFSPSLQMDQEEMAALFHANIILVSPDSAINSFSSNDFESFNLRGVNWVVNVTLDGINRAVRYEIPDELRKEMEEGKEAVNSSPILMREVSDAFFSIATEEVLMYIYLKCEELEVEFKAERRTRDVVKDLLEYFSVSEVFYFADNSVRNAHIFYSKGRARNKEHAGNTIPGKMEHLGQRAIDEEWTTSRYRRDTRLLQSEVSKTFCDAFLDGRDPGFDIAPGEYHRLKSSKNDESE